MFLYIVQILTQADLYNYSKKLPPIPLSYPINDRIKEKHFFFIGESADRSTLEFMIITKRTGKIAHQFIDGQYVFHRKNVHPSGKAFFICSVKGCPVKLQAKYESKEMCQGDLEPVITT